MKLVIERAFWLRGTGNGYLLDGNGKMCCLGFFGRALGQECLLGLGDPADHATEKCGLGGVECLWPEWLVQGLDDDGEGGYLRYRGTVMQTSLINVNDAIDMLESERERHIAELFARHGVDVEFVD